MIDELTDRRARHATAYCFSSVGTNVAEDLGDWRCCTMTSSCQTCEWSLGGIRFLSIDLLVLVVATGGNIFPARAQTPAFHDYVARPAFSSDRTKVATMDGNKIHVLDLKTGKELRVIKGHEFTVYAIAFSPDSQRILSGDGNCLRLWDVATGKQVFRLDGRNGNLNSLAISPDGHFAVSGHGAGSGTELIPPRDLLLWDLKAGKLVYRDRIILHRWVAQLLFSGGYELLPEKVREQLPVGVLDLFEGRTYSEVFPFEGQEHVNCVAFSPDGTRVACGCEDGRARVLDVATGRGICLLGGQGKGVQGVTFSPDGRHILACTGGGEVYLWRIRDGFQEGCFRGHNGAVYSVAFSPNGRLAVSGGQDQTMRLWSLEAGKELGCFRHLNATITTLVFSLDGRYAICADESGTVWRFRLPDY